MVLHAHVGLRGETCLFVQMYGQYRRSNFKIKNNLGFHFLPSNQETFKILLFSKNLKKFNQNTYLSYCPYHIFLYLLQRK